MAADLTLSVAARRALESVDLHWVGDILGKSQHTFRRICSSVSVRLTGSFCRKTNQYGLTSDTVKIYNIVLMVYIIVPASTRRYRTFH